MARHVNLEPCRSFSAGTRFSMSPLTLTTCTSNNLYFDDEDFEAAITSFQTSFKAGVELGHLLSATLSEQKRQAPFPNLIRH